MRNFPLLLVVALALYGCLRLYEDVSTFMKRDACLDAGRAWNYQFGRCE